MNLSLEIILAPILTIFVVQSIKLATDGIKGNFSLKNIFITYGGMPSTHAAFVTSLTAMVGYQEGVNSVSFGIAAVFAFIVIIDAIMLRKHIDQQGQAIMQLINKLPDSAQSEFPNISTKIEHTLPQVAVGMLIGFSIATLIQFLY